MSLRINQPLPASWLWVEIHQVAEAITGNTPPTSDSSNFGGDIPFIKPTQLVDTPLSSAPETLSDNGATNARILPKGAVLVSCIGNLGKTAILEKPGATNQQINALVFQALVNPKFGFFYAQTLEPWLNAVSSATTVSIVNKGKFETAPFPFAPTAEQTRIVEKLEELFSDLDAGVAELKAAQKKLAQYRQSLLKAAVEGSLTAEWRTKNIPKETGTQLLERILKERRTRWEEKQLAKFKEQGKTPPKGWQDKYPEPVQPDTTNLPGLPEGCLWASLDQFFCELRSGTAETSGRQTTPYPVLKSSAVRQGKIDFQALNYLQQKQSTRAENYLATGDVLITRLSGSVEYVGCCAVVQDVPTQGVQFPDRIFQGKLAPSFMWLGDYLAYCFQSAYVRIIIESAAKSTAGHKRISLSDLYPLPIPLPPAVEIKSIIQQLYSGIERAEAGEIAIIHSLTQAAAQRKNILKSAFSGQLVVQDPNDEPASLLLERIRAERQKQASTLTRGRKTAKLDKK